MVLTPPPSKFSDPPPPPQPCVPPPSCPPRPTKTHLYSDQHGGGVHSDLCTTVQPAGNQCTVQQPPPCLGAQSPVCTTVQSAQCTVGQPGPKKSEAVQYIQTRREKEYRWDIFHQFAEKKLHTCVLCEYKVQLQLLHESSVNPIF